MIVVQSCTTDGTMLTATAPLDKPQEDVILGHSHKNLRPAEQVFDTMPQGRPPTLFGDYKTRREYIEAAEPSPAVVTATRLYATGAVKSKKAAAKAVGLTPQYFTEMTNCNPEVGRLITDIDRQIADSTIEMSVLLANLSREAIGELAKLMRGTTSEHIKLKAAQDLADRGAETSKIQKHQVAAFSIAGEDAKQLAQVLVESARAQAHFAHAAQGEYVQIPPDVVDSPVIPPHISGERPNESPVAESPTSGPETAP